MSVPNNPPSMNRERRNVLPRPYLERKLLMLIFISDLSDNVHFCDNLFTRGTTVVLRLAFAYPEFL